MISFEYYNHLGFHNPYFITRDCQIVVEPSFNDIIEQIPPNKRILDFTAMVEVFSTGFCFGDRTLVEGIQKTPWMAKPNSDNTGWHYFDVPNHQENSMDEKDVAKQLYRLLEKELLHYIKPHQNIGILLTGGMDSRVVAAVLKNVIEEGKVSGKSVFAYTWGHELSRDVVYAARIAKLYGWSWKHLVVDENQMLENCELSVYSGCEFTPIHLHAMAQISRESHLDCALAGSFGDSVGRAEFSGKKVRDLTSLEAKIRNIGGILRSDFYQFAIMGVKQDINKYHQRFPQKQLYQQYEQDQQLHYMRRMLNACMSVIDKKFPLYQMFSSPSVFGYMWSLDPKVRTDSIYFHILKDNAPELLEIPWARTGLPYPSTEGVADAYKKKHHDYGKMIRETFLGNIEKTLDEDKVLTNMLFNTRCLKRLIHNLRKTPILGSIIFEDRILYAARILDLIKHRNLTFNLPRYKESFFFAMREDLRYKAKYLYKKTR